MIVGVSDRTVEIIRATIADIRLVKGRAVLAVIGIAIGTAAVVATLHVGHNASREALRQFVALGTDLVTMELQPSGSAAPEVRIGYVLDLPKKGLGISNVSAIVQTGGSIRARRSNVQANILAATDGIYALAKGKLAYGRFTSDLDGFSSFAVLGAEIASSLQGPAKDQIAMGERVNFNGQTFTVIGILEDTPPNLLLNLELNRSVIIPFAAARRVTSQVAISQVAGRLSSGANDEKTAEAVAKYFEPLVTNGFMHVATARQLIASIEHQMRIYATLILGIGAVSLVVGGVGIMNVMLMSVMERRQEIGLRLAIGARRNDIRLMFLCETIILATIGSALGTMLGYLAGWLFANGSDWQFEPAPLAVPLGAGMALVVGLFFGVYPAFLASRLDPVVALRSE
ncbi:ABC transporter permease [Peteryoungia ipomoeae]|uniref:ABC transporter permease n=1 Tax=Peteryoungia ipomoeae TaxID=1210932 RepID=A0A4S8NTD9_9HYPH|nr:ABC transporter permease [Peteryoungia ipomoeae]THV19851.1 ABC transporter permease [Peteryoungia ipomoeae]